MIRTYDTGNIVPAGAAGSATGAFAVGPIDGEVLAVHVDYDAACAATTVVAVSAASNGGNPAVPILTTPAGKASQTWYPRVALCDVTGAAVTFDGAHGQVGRIPVAGDYVYVAVTAANPTAPVRVFLTVETMKPH